MLRPTRLTEAHGPITCTRHSRDRSATRSATRRVVERVGRRIERHGDVGLGGRHQIDRHAVLLEHLEGIGEEADLVPHARALERNQRDALLGADRLHLRAAVAAVGAEHRALEVRRLRGIDVQRNAVLPHRQDAARVQHLRAAGGDLLGLVVVQRAQQPRGGRGARIGAEHAGHVGPDLQPLRPPAWRRDTPRRCPSRRGRAAPCCRRRRWR